MRARTKAIVLYNCLVRLYTFDGRTWATSRRDLAEYHQRVATEKRDLQAQFARIDTSQEREIRY